MAEASSCEAGALVIAGHFGFAAVVKSREPQVPLWSLMLACQWMDVLFVPLFALGIERIVPIATAGPHPGYGEGIIYADYTHSLLGALVIAVTFGLSAAWFWGGRNGAVLAGAVLSRTGCWTCWSIAPTCLFCPAMRATFRDSASACGAFP